MKTGMTASARWSLIFWSCAMVVLLLSLMPPVPHIPTTGWDKSNHLLAFSVLAILGCRAYPAHIAVVLVGLLLYGGLIEVLQFFTPYRLAEWGDLIADGLGIIVGYGLQVFLRQFKRTGYSD
jgi:VanZ family protein